MEGNQIVAVESEHYSWNVAGKKLQFTHFPTQQKQESAQEILSKEQKQGDKRGDGKRNNRKPNFSDTATKTKLVAASSTSSVLQDPQASVSLDDAPLLLS